MPNGKDHELAGDLAKLRAETIRTQGEAAWEAVARFIDLPDDDRHSSPGSRRDPTRGGIVGAKPKKAPALTRNPNAPKGVSWRDLRGERGDPVRASLRLMAVRARSGARCVACDVLVPRGEDVAVVTTWATQRRFCPSCGTAELRRLEAGGTPGEGSGA